MKRAITWISKHFPSHDCHIAHTKRCKCHLFNSCLKTYIIWFSFLSHRPKSCRLFRKMALLPISLTIYKGECTGCSMYQNKQQWTQNICNNLMPLLSHQNKKTYGWSPSSSFSCVCDSFLFKCHLMYPLSTTNFIFAVQWSSISR